ncbi:MAG: hypothetical protein KDD66_14295 [Bdellovibrionales bacterium]|nr:hypothetical protein [Bdellovibrionales bacterium]
MRKPTFREVILTVLLGGACFWLWRLQHPSFEMIEFYSAHPSWCEKPHDVVLPPTEPAAKANDDTIRVLFIGNSHTYVNDVPQIVSQLAEAGGLSMHVETHAFGGYSLPQHWNDKSAATRIATGDWDFVVLQGQSACSAMCSAEMSKAVGLLDEVVRSVGAETVLYMVWVRDDIESNQDPWTASYMLAAEEHHVRVAPAGYVWQQLEERDFDYRMRSYDGNHATPVGSFVSALTLAATLLGKSPSSLLESLEQRFPGAIRDHGFDGGSLKLLETTSDDALESFAKLSPADIGRTSRKGLDFLGAVFYQHKMYREAQERWERHGKVVGDSEAVKAALRQIEHD